MFTSPVAIVLYVISAIGLIATIIAHMHKEKYITSILKSSPVRRTRMIKAYRNIISLQKILICILPILIVLMIIDYFVVSKDDFLLLMIGFAAIALIKVIEDILFRKYVIARVETGEYATDPQFTAPDYSPAYTTSKIRKLNIRLSLIGITISVVMLSAFSTALYFTIGGHVWAYVVITIFTLLVVCVTLKTTVK